MSKELKCMIFDMDGTLVDSEKVYQVGFRRAFDHFDIEISHDEIVTFSGLSGEEEMELLDTYTKDRAVSEDLFSRMMTYCMGEFSEDRVQLKSHAISLLQHCKEQGLKVGLATSTHEKDAVRLLKKLAIFPYFDFFVFGDHVETPKPDPANYKLALQRSGSLASECLAVEDSRSGVTSAHLAGIAVVQICDDTKPVDLADYHITSLQEIEGIMANKK